MAERGKAAEAAEVHPSIEHAWDGTPAALSEAHLERYLAHLRVPRPQAPTAAALAELQLAHLFRIPFENLDTMLGIPVALEHDALVAKLLSGTRGGYCYEHNMLLAGALVRLGYRVQTLAARALVGVDGGPLPRTHVTLRVESQDAGERIVDVGFGRASLTAALPATPGEVVTMGPDQYRVVDHDGELAVQTARLQGPWVSLYLVDPRPVYPIDLAMANHFVATHPRSPMAERVVVLQTTPEGKRSIRGHVLTVDDGDRQFTRDFKLDELDGLLRDEFGIVLPRPLATLPA